MTPRLNSKKLWLLIALGTIALFTIVHFVRTSDQVIANGKSWLTARCYSEGIGWSTLLLATTNPIEEADAELRNGSSRFMKDTRKQWDLREENYSLRAAGINCVKPVGVRDPPGYYIPDDFIATECHHFHLLVQQCVALTFNYQLHQKLEIAGHTGCFQYQKPNCPRVNAPWKLHLPSDQ